MFFFKESVVYPFAPFEENKGHHIIFSEDYCKILAYVDKIAWLHCKHFVLFDC